MPAKVESFPPLPGLSPVGGKPLLARFDGGRLSSDGGVLALCEIERRLGIADRLAACLDDPRAPGHSGLGLEAQQAAVRAFCAGHTPLLSSLRFLARARR